MSNVTAMPTKRRLAAVLSMDVAGYARLMEADEADTLGRLTRYRASIEDNLAEHGGRLVGTAGDSLLAEFQSAVGAVEAALAVQAHMAEENAEAPAERRMLFRMGITVGDVMAEIGDPGAGDIHGETVNLAARLQTHAEPGAVLISSAVFNEVRNKLDVAFVDLGALSVKNITHPVHIYGVGLSGTLRAADELARLEPGVSPASAYRRLGRASQLGAGQPWSGFCCRGRRRPPLRWHRWKRWRCPCRRGPPSPSCRSRT